MTTRGRTPFYLEHMRDKRDNETAKCLRAVYEHRERLLGISRILVGDCLFSSYNFVTGANAIGFEVVSRLRDDAVLQYLYNGPRKSSRGRPKEVDGTVNIKDLREGVFAEETVGFDGDLLVWPKGECSVKLNTRTATRSPLCEQRISRPLIRRSRR